MSSGCAVANSPIFSPSIFCRTTSSCSTSPMSSSSPPLPLALCVQKQKTNQQQEVNNTSSKRKRPAKLHVPFSTLSFDVNTPKTKFSVDALDEVEVKGDEYSVYCKRGRRGSSMEDRYSALLGIEGDPNKAIFGVFDGHGGAEAAEFAARNIDKNIASEVSGRCKEEEIKEAVRNAYLSTDKDFLKKGVHGGACCVTAFINEGDLVVSNAGDCRAVLSRGGVAEALTSDHRPSREDEKERIENSGGYVDFCRGVWRIHGSLAVSRGIGDRHLKEWVTAEPETKVLRIESDCEFLVLASDGLWDKVSNQEAVDEIRPLCVGLDKPDLFGACKNLVHLSARRGSTDDISVLIVQLGRFVQ